MSQVDPPLFGGNLRWFGESWGAPVNEIHTHIPAPVGEKCSGHEHMHGDPEEAVIHEGDRGVTIPYMARDAVVTIVFHLHCWLHEIGADRVTVEGKTE